jgi:hypothetical protein
MFVHFKGSSLFRGGVLCIFAAFLVAGTSVAQTIDHGNLVGTIFDRDGKTPIPGAVVKLRNITSGSVYESPPTDAKGFFRMERVGKGIYQYGVATPAGDFNSNELVGIIANETTKISVTLSQYDTAVQSAVQEILRAQSDKEGEVRIGRVVRFNPATKDAEVFIEMGILQRNDRVRVKGPITNYYQNAEKLGAKGVAVKQLLAGESGLLRLDREADPNDGLYVVCSGGTPFFLTPCGIASVIAGTGAVLGIITRTKDVDPVSPIR